MPCASANPPIALALSPAAFEKAPIATARSKAVALEPIAVAPKPVEVKEKRFSILPGLIAISSIFLVGAFAPESFMNHFIVFVLSCFIGYMVIWNVTASLHTPLMSVTNAVSSIIIIGALSQISSPNLFSLILSGFAVFIASISPSFALILKSLARTSDDSHIGPTIFHSDDSAVFFSMLQISCLA